MLPPTSHPIWKGLITGEKQLKSANVGINMLLYNSSLKYKRDPSPANLRQLVQHIYDYFAKFERTLQAEIQQILS
jgi:hypothetical protein